VAGRVPFPLSKRHKTKRLKRHYSYFAGVVTPCQSLILWRNIIFAGGGGMFGFIVLTLQR